MLDLLAPGTDMISTLPNEAYSLGEAGTSFAAPVVAGVLALLRSEIPSGLGARDYINMLNLSAFDRVDGNTYTFSDTTGFGILDADALLDNAGEFECNAATASMQRSTQVWTETKEYEIYAAGLSGAYDVMAYRITTAVSFSGQYSGDAFFWGDGEATTGWSLASPNLGVSYCRVDPATAGGTGGTLETYVFQVFDYSGNPIGWYPCSPENVVLGYKSWGVPARAEARQTNGSAPTGRSTQINLVRVAGSSVTEFAITIPRDQRIKVNVYDIRGHAVRTIHDGFADAGYHRYEWNGLNDAGQRAPSGIFLVKVKGTDLHAVRKFSYVR